MIKQRVEDLEKRIGVGRVEVEHHTPGMTEEEKEELFDRGNLRPRSREPAYRMVEEGFYVTNL